MVTSAGDGALIEIRVIPRAGKSAVAGTRGGALLVRLNAPPVEGAANAELIALLAATLGVAKGWIIIGHNMSEESGMQEMADWLRPIVPEVKVAHVRAGVVYWVPE